jgi:tetratricopeptide (TPR) repeat protein
MTDHPFRPTRDSVTIRLAGSNSPAVDDFEPNPSDDPSDLNGGEPSSARKRAHEKLAQRAAEHFRRGRLKEAEADLRKAIAGEPSRGDWHFNLGLTLEAAGRLEDALRSFRDAVMRMPRRAEARFAEGSILCRLERYIEAITPLTTATTLDRRCEPAWAKLVEVHGALGELDEAETVYYLAQEALDRMPLVLVAMGDLQLGRERHDRAAWCFREALSQAPEMPRLRSRLARALLLGGTPDAALRMYLEELRANPGDVGTLLECGDLLAAQRRIGDAVEKYRRAAELAPNLAAPRARLGMVLVAIGRPEQAKAELELAYALEPNAQLVRLSLAGVLAGEGSHDAALRLLREEAARRRDFGSDVASAELQRATDTFVACGAPSDAADLLERVWRERPEDLDLARKLMTASFAAGRRRRARGLARQIARNDPSFAAGCAYNLALDALECGRLRLARARVRRASKEFAGDASFRSLRMRLVAETLRLWRDRLMLALVMGRGKAR